MSLNISDKYSRNHSSTIDTIVEYILPYNRYYGCRDLSDLMDLFYCASVAIKALGPYRALCALISTKAQ